MIKRQEGRGRMIISAIELTNFKSFGPEPVWFPLAPMTAFVGENNSGKSNALLALDLFRHFSKKKVKKEHFHSSNTSKPITIKITYGYLSDDEKRLFQRHLAHDEALTITQTISCTGSDTDDRNSGNREVDIAVESFEISEEKTASYARSGIDWLDEPPTTKRDIAKLWKEELRVGEIDFKEWCGLSPNAPPTKEDLSAKVADFWHEHWDDIPKGEEPTGTQPLGWPNRLTGNLPEVVFIPALKSISEEAKSTKTSPFGSLLSWLISSVQADLRSEIQSKLDTIFSEALAALPKEYDEESGKEITRLELINRTLNRSLLRAFDASLKVDFKRPEVDNAIFGETVLNADDGFLSEINEKGHGLQRAAIIAIIRTYLSLRVRLEAATPGLGRVIFVIEEPEIYLHPTVKRSAYMLFRELAKGGDQVVYSTHDGYFIDVEHFDEIRVFRKQKVRDTPYTTVDFLEEDTLLRVWREVCRKDDIQIESVREHLHNVYDPHRNEGFLAKGVIICEGQTEAGTLPIYLRALDFDLDEHGIAVVSAGSVDLLDYFYLLFSELGIPVFVLWDGDRPAVNDVRTLTGDSRSDAEKKSKRNHYLAGLFGAILPKRGDGSYFTDEDIVWDTCAMFARKFESTVHSVLPNSEEILSQAKKLYGSDSKPMIARYYARKVLEVGKDEGEPAKFIPPIFVQVKEKLVDLRISEKQSSKLKAEETRE